MTFASGNEIGQHLLNSHVKSSAKNIILQPGESIKIFTKNLAKTWVSQGKIVSIKDGGNFLNIQARKVGKVSINIGSQLYKIQVLPSRIKHHFKLLQQLVQNRQGLEVKVRLNKKFQLYITGQLLRIKDFKDLSKIVQKHNIFYLFSAKVPLDLRFPLKDFLQKQIYSSIHNSLDEPDSSTDTISKKQFFDSFLLSWNQKPLQVILSSNHPYFSLYQEHLRPYGISLKKDPTLIAHSSLVELKILLVETSSHHSIQSPFFWGTKSSDKEVDHPIKKEISENFVAHLLNRSFQKWLSLFKSMESQGDARILAQAVLLNEHNKTSRFHSGGKVPIPHYHPKTGSPSIQWKPYGINLKFTTQIGRKKNIHIQTQVNISDVDHSHSVHSAPAIKSSPISSSLTLQNGQTLVLSTLLRQQTGKGHLAPHIISSLPLIGKLFSSSGKIKERTKLNIFVTVRKVLL